MAEFGALIRTTRERRGETGTQLAQRLGVAHSTVVRMERGQMSNPPDTDLFRRLSESLDLPGTKMLEALGYLDASDTGSGGDTPAVATVRAILGNKEYSEKQLEKLDQFFRSTLEIIDGMEG